MRPTDSEILFAFTETLPPGYRDQPILISGEESVKEKNCEYLLLKQNDSIQKVLEIRFMACAGPYKEALIFNNLLVVGHYEFLYLFDLVSNTAIVRSQMAGYFGHLYVNDNQLFVSGASAIYCFDSRGKMIWKNSNLGIDGVFISDFDKDKIVGSGQWDPPGGWRDFILDRSTGYHIR
jgi:hypothetical protein